MFNFPCLGLQQGHTEHRNVLETLHQEAFNLGGCQLQPMPSRRWKAILTDLLLFFMRELAAVKQFLALAIASFPLCSNAVAVGNLQYTSVKTGDLGFSL